MDIITIDFETLYSSEYSLSKMTTEEYIRHPEFEVIGVAVKVNDGRTQSFSGPMQDTAEWLGQFDWKNSLALAHNAMFDGAIMSWVFGIKPKGWLDTLSMARALHGTNVGGSLKFLAEYYGVGAKGEEVVNAMGKRRTDFDEEQMNRYMAYCRNDVDLTWDIFNHMAPDFPQVELRLIDLTLRMFTEPVLQLSVGVLSMHLAQVQSRKATLMEAVEIERDDLMSNPKFADALRLLGVEPPMKISPTTGKQTYAFAKSDEEFKALLEHENPSVQALVAARLGVKSTLEETRTERFIGIANRGPMPVPLRYYAAHTGRWGGDDKLNLQNLPRNSPLKSAIIAPEGYVILDSDSSQIEARTVAWLAGQNDLVDAFDRGEDVYKIMASAIYGIPAEQVNKDQRFVGKTTILGAGYGMGAAKFRAQLKTFNVEIDEAEAQHIIRTYRETYPMIPQFWEAAHNVLSAILFDQYAELGRSNLLKVEGRKGIRLPNGLHLKYPNLRKAQNEDGKTEWVYDTRKGKTSVPTRVYGGKLTENCIAVGTPVLTARGWVPIERIRSDDLVHDGVEFVAHGGMVFKSVQPCVTVDGVYMTPDHEVLTYEGWKVASQNPEPYRPDLRHVAGGEPRAQQWEETQLEVPMPMRETVHQSGCGRTQRDQARGDTKLWLSNNAAYFRGESKTWNEQAPGVCGVEEYGGPVPTTNAPSVEELRGPRHHGLSGMAGVLRKLLVRHGTYLRSWFGFKPRGQRRAVFPGELCVEHAPGELYEQAEHRAAYRRSSSKQGDRDSAHYAVLPVGARMAGGATDAAPLPEKQVYDIMDCGPRHRFVVLGTAGPFIVHNCCQALARIAIGEQMLMIAKKYKVVMTVHDAIACLVPEDEADQGQEFVEMCMRIRPAWAPELPLNCEAGYGRSYGDC